MRRRGQGHIEMILSFILFIGAVFFVLLFFNPSKSIDLVGGSTSFVFAQVAEQLETEVVRYGVRIVQPTLVIGLRLSRVPVGVGSRAVTEGGLVVASGITGNLVSAEHPAGVGFMTVEVSDAFPSGGLVGGGGDEDAVVVSSSVSEKILSEKKLQLLQQRYHQDYETLKHELAIPPGINFRFLVLFGGGDRLEAKRDVPTGVDVFVEEQRREIIRLDGKREFASLVVSLW